MKLAEKYLTRSILLEESATPLLLRLTLVFSSLILFIFIVWIFFAKVDELAFTTGEIIPPGYNVKIQHPEGGKITAIYVRNGDQVKEGQTLLLLDSDMAKINKEESEKKLQIIQEKEKLLEQQVEIAQNLTEKQLNSKMSFLSLKGELSDIKLKKLELLESIKKAEKSLELTTTKAPFSGTVHNFEFRSPGEVVAAAKVIMEIIPHNPNPVAEIRISAKDIGLIKTGMKATIKVATFDFTRFGTIEGEVTELSVSSYLDENRIPYYKGLVTLDKNHLGYQNGLYPVLPGMSINAEIITGQKTIFQYLLKPIYVSVKTSFHER